MLKPVFIIGIMAVAMIGIIIVEEARAAEEVAEEETPLTINSLEIYEDQDYTRYRVTGDAPASTEITFKTTKPDGSPGNFPGGVNTGKSAYIVDNKIDSTNNLVYGTWTLKVCAPEYDVCVQELFTINEPVTLSKDGITQAEEVSNEKSTEEGGGCLIATAIYGSEMSDEVQQLRELRDNQLLQTESGTAFMSTFNDIYYTFSPIIADYERENPYFKEAVKIAITPMISTFIAIMENAESESEVLGLGLSVIALNLGMYLGVPAIVVVGIRKIK